MDAAAYSAAIAIAHTHRKEPIMSKIYRTQAVAWTLATLVTLTLLAGLDLLAQPVQANSLLARQQPAAAHVSVAPTSGSPAARA
jgi:hypothetical protein